MTTAPITNIIAPRRRPVAGARLTGNPLVDWMLVASRNRSFLGALIKRDLQSRYRGSMLGVAWLVGVPIAMMATYTFVFSGIFNVKFGSNGGPHEGHINSALSIWCGLFMWQVVSETCSRAVSILHDNAPYVKRVAFPLPLLPLMPLGTATMGGLVSFALFAIVYVAVDGRPPASWICAPVIYATLVCLAAGASWILASMGTFLRDLKLVVPMMMTIGMFVTPVMYPLSSVPGRLAGVIALNPLASVFEMTRQVLIEGEGPDPWRLGLNLLLAMAFACAGYALFAYREWEYADVV